MRLLPIEAATAVVSWAARLGSLMAAGAEDVPASWDAVPWKPLLADVPWGPSWPAES